MLKFLIFTKNPVIHIAKRYSLVYENPKHIAISTTFKNMVMYVRCDVDYSEEPIKKLNCSITYSRLVVYDCLTIMKIVQTIQSISELVLCNILF